jgi:hypothetical protein
MRFVLIHERPRRLLQLRCDRVRHLVHVRNQITQVHDKDVASYAFGNDILEQAGLQYNHCNRVPLLVSPCTVSSFGNFFSWLDHEHGPQPHRLKRERDLSCQRPLAVYHLPVTTLSSAKKNFSFTRCRVVARDLMLLNLRDEDCSGTKRLNDWPTGLDF